MNHEQMKEKILAFHDGELPPKESRVISAHLKSCEECRSVYEKWDRIHAALHVKTPAPSERFVSSVMDRIADLEEPAVAATVFRRPVFRWVAPLAGYAFALILMFFVLIPQETPVSTGNLLLSDASEGVRQFFSNESLGVDQLFNGKED